MHKEKHFDKSDQNEYDDAICFQKFDAFLACQTSTNTDCGSRFHFAKMKKQFGVVECREYAAKSNSFTQNESNLNVH